MTYKRKKDKSERDNILCTRSSSPFHVVTNYIKWVTTSWTDSTHPICKCRFSVNCRFNLEHSVFRTRPQPAQSNVLQSTYRTSRRSKY